MVTHTSSFVSPFFCSLQCCSIYCSKQNVSMHCQFLIRKHWYPAGIRHPCETKFDNHLQDLEHSNYTLNIPLIPTTPEEMEDMFRLCSHVRFKIPQQVRSTLENERIMDFTLCALTVDDNHGNNYRIIFACGCLNLCFHCLDSPRIGRCPTASQHILPRRLVPFGLKDVSIQHSPWFPSPSSNFISLFLLVFMEIVGENSRYALQEHLHLITAPLQVIWGKQDQVQYDVPLIQWLSKAYINTELITRQLLLLK